MDRWDKIENAYHGARDLTGEDRSHFLDKQCGSDAPMRRQVEALLAQDDNPNSFLNRPAVELPGEWRSLVRNMGALTGLRIGPYEILEPIGSGGMGDVYRAWDTKLQRAAALKFLPAQLRTDPGRLVRFEREARTVAALNHPNIAGIYGLEESDAGQALALELVEGPTLGDRIAQGPIPVEEVLSIARQIAEALNAAHVQGFIHRDLKPANIKLRPDGTVKVLDFGLAKALEPVAGIEMSITPSAGSPATTQVGVILGTAAYMSPEQVMARSLDKRCDVWAFGCVLYEMLTGRRAFPGDDVSDILAAVLRGKPDWSALPTTVPPQIRTLVEGCLTKDRKKCIADFSTVQFRLNAQQLGAPAAGQPFARRQPWVRDRTDQTTSDSTSQHEPAPFNPLVKSIVDRHTRVLIVGGVLLAALLVSVGLLRFRSMVHADARAIRSLAVLPLTNLTGDPAQAYLADGMTDALITELAQSSGLRIIAQSSVIGYRDPNKPLAQIARELNVDGIIEGAVVQSGSRVRITARLLDARTDRHLWARSYERDPNDLVGLQRDFARAISGAVVGKLVPRAEGEAGESRPVNAEAYGLFFHGLVAASAQNYEGFRNAITYTKRALEKQPDFAAAYARMALYYLQFSFTGPMAPKEFMPEAEAAARKAVALDDALAEGHAVLADVLYRFHWDWSGSEMEFRRALALNANFADGHRNFAGLLSAMGRHEEAVIEAQRSRELDPMSIQAGLDLGRAYRAARQYDRAIAEFRQAVAKDPNRPRIHFQFGQTYVQKGMLTEGIGELETAVKLSPDNARFSSCLAYAYAVSGRTTVARAILETLQSRIGPQHVSSTAIARIYVGLDDKPAALGWLERAYRERDFDLIAPDANTGLVELRSDPYYHEIFARMGLF